MKTEFDIKLTVKDMYRFSMYHAYTGSQGIISIVIAILSFIAAVKTYGSVQISYTILYAVFGVIFLVYMPVSLYMRSKRQVLSSEVLKNKLHYLVDDTGIHTSQNEQTADLLWEQIYKIIATRQNVLVYSNRVNAYVIPREQLGQQYEVLKQIASAHMPKYRFKMK